MTWWQWALCVVGCVALAVVHTIVEDRIAEQRRKRALYTGRFE